MSPTSKATDLIARCGGPLHLAYHLNTRFGLTTHQVTVERWARIGIPEEHWARIIEIADGAVTANDLLEANEEIRSRKVEAVN